MKPKQVVIVHGTREATEHLANFCEQAGWASGRVHTPRIKETVNVTSETHMFEVKLSDQLVNSLDFIKAKDCELAWIDGQIDTNTEALSSKQLRPLLCSLYHFACIVLTIDLLIYSSSLILLSSLD
jgi:cleavage and polyadenylation specificity factor subunit 2